LRRDDHSNLELDFDTDPHDIRIVPDFRNTKYKRERTNQNNSEDIEIDYSLRAYCRILYLQPRMNIYIRGEKVEKYDLKQALPPPHHTDTYKPFGSNMPFKIHWGMTPPGQHDGIMLYHNNRLIIPYLRLNAYMYKNNTAKGIMGIMSADFLNVRHDKQDFAYTPGYRSCLNRLSDLFKLYNIN